MRVAINTKVLHVFLAMFSVVFLATGEVRADLITMSGDTANIEAIDQAHGLLDWKDLVDDDPNASTSSNGFIQTWSVIHLGPASPYNLYAVIKNSYFAETNWSNATERTAYSYFDTSYGERRYWALIGSGGSYRLEKQSADTNMQMIVGAVPEPSTALLLGIGLTALGMRRRAH